MGKQVVRRGPAGSGGRERNGATDGGHDEDEVLDLRDRWHGLSTRFDHPDGDDQQKPGSSGTGSDDADPRQAAIA
jgi:hypothetical protein